MKKLIFGLFFVLAGCNDPKATVPDGYQCYGDCNVGDQAFKDTCQDADKLAKFVVDCARAANPMSDEEGEDLVRECGNQSRSIFCKRDFITLTINK